MSDDDATAESTEAPRPHHYVFAHIVLRTLAFDDPLKFFGAMASPAADEFLDLVHGDMCERLAAEGPCPFESRDVTHERGKLGEHLCVMFRFPWPERRAEAYFTAFTGRLDPAKTAATMDDIEARYFTLEYTLDEHGAPATFLCEWTKDGTHMNYGAGPEPTREEFLRVIGARLASATRPAHSEFRPGRDERPEFHGEEPV